MLAPETDPLNPSSEIVMVIDCFNIANLVLLCNNTDVLFYSFCDYKSNLCFHGNDKDTSHDLRRWLRGE